MSFKKMAEAMNSISEEIAKHEAREAEQARILGLFTLWVNRKIRPEVYRKAGITEPELEHAVSAEQYAADMDTFYEAVEDIAVPAFRFRFAGQADYARWTTYDTPGLLMHAQDPEHEDGVVEVTVDESFFRLLNSRTIESSSLQVAAYDWARAYARYGAAIVGVDSAGNPLVVNQNGKEAGVVLFAIAKTWVDDTSGVDIDIDAYLLRAFSLRLQEEVGWFRVNCHDPLAEVVVAYAAEGQAARGMLYNEEDAMITLEVERGYLAELVEEWCGFEQGFTGWFDEIADHRVSVGNGRTLSTVDGTEW